VQPSSDASRGHSVSPAPILKPCAGKVLTSLCAVSTNVIFWVLVLALAWGMLCGVARSAPAGTGCADDGSEDPPPSSSEAAPTWTGGKDGEEHGVTGAAGASSLAVEESRPISGLLTAAAGDWERTDQAQYPPEIHIVQDEPPQISTATKSRYLHPTILVLVCGIVIGTPLSAYSGEDRLLDVCVLCLAWMASVQAQAALKAATSLPVRPSLQRALWILMNPVLLTTLTLFGFTRTKASLMHRALVDVLDRFSGGSPLERLLSYWALRFPLEEDQSDWFGAGDVALTLLQCGMVAWGFKLYECRRQLWSCSGLLVIIASMAAAVLSSFISVALGTAMGLDEPEALAFAARSTTLALAKPATESLHGNTAVNAGVVVSNGIVGQLVAPYLLQLLGVLDVDDEEEGELRQRARQTEGDEAAEEMSERKRGEGEERRLGSGRDSAAAIAAGAVVGVNGIGMGVAYLYERRSRAAPYAALSMTSFGVATTLLAAMDPFRGALLSLARS
jgi:putative effector of murein hydrolase